MGPHYLNHQGCPPFPGGSTPPHSPCSGEPSYYPCGPLLLQHDSNAAGLLLRVLQPSDKGPPHLLHADAQVSGMLLRKLARIQGSAPMDSHSPCHVPFPAGSTGPIGSGASLPPGGHISHTCSETPIWMRDQPSSSSSCSHCSDSDTDGHKSKGSGSPPDGQSDGEQDCEANKSTSDHSDGEESDGNAEEQDKSGQQDNTQETDESSSDKTSSETKSSKAPASEVAKSAIVESDSEDSESSTDSDSREIRPSVPTPKKEGKEGKEARPSMVQSSSLLFLDPKLPEEQWKIEQHNHARSLDANFSKWRDEKIQKGCEAWKTQSVMTCEHRHPGKEIKSKDPTEPPLDYMVSHDVFKVKQTSGYDMCHFPHPAGWQPVRSCQTSSTRPELRGDQSHSHATSNSVTAVSLLSNLHNKNSLHCLSLDGKGKIGS